MACYCDMKGFLSYLILWILSKGKLTGAQIAQELKARKGRKPSPGTIYPALKELNKKGLISADKTKTYSLTKKGKKELQNACTSFCSMFYDMKEMSKCCK